MDHWSPSKIGNLVAHLPEDSALRRKYQRGWSSLHELLAATHDQITVLAHNYAVQGKPKPYPRPGAPEQAGPVVNLGNPDDAAAVRRFFAPRT